MDATTTLTPTEVIDRVQAARKAEQAAAFEQLELAHAWAVLHPCPAGQDPAHWGDPQLHCEAMTPLAGAGAPWVAEFAPADLGAALGITLDAARMLIGDALELTYRLPRLRDLAAQGLVPVWRARLVARLTTDLSIEAALFADRMVAATPERINQVSATRLVNEARLYFDPDRAVADEEEALARRGVWLRKNTSPATSDLSMSLDAVDALLFDATVTRIAADLKHLGDADDLDTRRARAVGILADPQHALDLMSGRPDAAPSPTSSAVNLLVHCTPDDLADDAADRGLVEAAHSDRGEGQPARRHRPRPSQSHSRQRARPTGRDARDGDPARRPLRVSGLSTRLQIMRPRPCHRIPPDAGWRTTRPNPPRESRTSVPHAPPVENPLGVGLQTTRQRNVLRRLHLDEPYGAPVRRQPDVTTPCLENQVGPGPSPGPQVVSRTCRWRSPRLPSCNRC